MDGQLRQVTFRVRHDCPLARLSVDAPTVRFTVWSGHGIEVLAVSCSRNAWDAVLEAARRHVEVQRAFATAEGGLIVASLQVPPERSISRTLETHHCVWLQPMRLE